jgi:hypothetical protein
MGIVHYVTPQSFNTSTRPLYRRVFSEVEMLFFPNMVAFNYCKRLIRCFIPCILGALIYLVMLALLPLLTLCSDENFYLELGEGNCLGPGFF